MPNHEPHPQTPLGQPILTSELKEHPNASESTYSPEDFLHNFRDPLIDWQTVEKSVRSLEAAKIFKLVSVVNDELDKTGMTQMSHSQEQVINVLIAAVYSCLRSDDFMITQEPLAKDCLTAIKFALTRGSTTICSQMSRIIVKKKLTEDFGLRFPQLDYELNEISDLQAANYREVKISALYVLSRRINERVSDPYPGHKALYQQHYDQVHAEIQAIMPEKESKLWRDIDPILKLVAALYAKPSDGVFKNDEIVRKCKRIEERHPGLLTRLYTSYGLVPGPDTTESSLLALDALSEGPGANLEQVLHSNPEQLAQINEAFNGLLHATTSSVISGLLETIDKNRSILESLSRSGSESTQLAAQNLLLARQDKTIIASAILRDIDRQDSGLYPEYKLDKSSHIKLLSRVLPNNLDATVCWRAWLTQDEPKVAANIDRIQQLEFAAPGGAAKLQKDYGILNFERYPLEILLSQLEHEVDSRPYVLILNPHFDWNGAFSSNESLWSSVYRQLDVLGYNLKIVEAGSKFGVARRLLDLDNRFGIEHKISAMFVGGHGTKDSINFGGEDSRHQLLTSDLQGEGVASAGQFLEHNSTLILVSCSTGSEGGIGEKLHDMLGATVIAPNTPTNIRAINIRLNNGRLEFDVQYAAQDSTTVFTPNDQIT